MSLQLLSLIFLYIYQLPYIYNVLIQRSYVAFIYIVHWDRSQQQRPQLICAGTLWWKMLSDLYNGVHKRLATVNITEQLRKGEELWSLWLSIPCEKKTMLRYKNSNYNTSAPEIITITKGFEICLPEGYNIWSWFCHVTHNWKIVSSMELIKNQFKWSFKSQLELPSLLCINILYIQKWNLSDLMLLYTYYSHISST